MKRAALIGFGCLAAFAAAAQPGSPKSATATSRSGQFMIRGIETGTARPFVPAAATNSALVNLVPSLVAISCERIKQALLGTLTVPDQWRGKIYLVLHPVRRVNEDIVVTTARFNQVWQYEISLPDYVDPNRFIRAVTQVLLLEMANRQEPPQSAELPAWLAEGMPQLLTAGSDLGLVLKPAPPATGPTPSVLNDFREGRHSSPFTKARERLRQRDPLTIQQLGWPTPAQLTGTEAAVFRDNAMLFIDELLHLPNGGACLAAMLPELPWDPDWRTGFLKGFKPHFQREMDFEKWWTLQSAFFAGRDRHQTWPRTESLAKLNEALRTPFEVRLGSNEPPMFTDVSLQAVIQGWKPERQSPVLKEIISILENLRLRVAPELRPLVGQYREVLAAYLEKTSGLKKNSFTPGWHLFSEWLQKGKPSPPSDSLLKETLLQLDALDDRRAAWQQVPE